ncbi:hypothetical protein BJX64DRAFT_265931 [Aspergillus heterothallicus]
MTSQCLIPIMQSWTPRQYSASWLHVKLCGTKLGETVMSCRHQCERLIEASTQIE